MKNHRFIYQPTDQLSQSILYKADISPDLHCLLCAKSMCSPSTCLCFPTVSAKAAESAYLHVYENRIEYNYPLTTLSWNCSCHVVDNVKTIYFDRTQIQEVYALEGCCCGYDQTVVLNQSCMTCADVEVDTCCGNVYLPCIENAKKIVTCIIEQKTKRLGELQIVTNMDRGENKDE
jgi:hypothetical protein